MILLSACDLPPPEDAVEAPCDEKGGTVLELGPAVRASGGYGQFSTTGATIWVTATSISTGGVLDTDQTRIEVGRASEAPEYDGSTGEETASVLVQASVKEGYWSPLDLESGEYWLWSSAGGLVTVQTCTAGAIFDAIPATIPPEPTD
jgi:hypothetical protein